MRRAHNCACWASRQKPCPYHSQDANALSINYAVMKPERRLVLLPGLLLLLLACHVVPSQQQDLLIIPDVAPYPPLKPLDKGYPGNIPADVPNVLPPAPAILQAGANTTCSTTVSAVLEAHNRTLLAQYLAATPQGMLALSGAMQATILAPTDNALKRVLASQENGLMGPAAASTVALYHVLNGKEKLAKLGKPWGRWWNTTLTRAACPTASQAVTVFSVDQAVYARSATSTARISAGDLYACNSIVHLVDQALQPCCVSLFEELHWFSIVKIQPSVFDGYKAQEPAGNSDDFNRRLFEEAMVDLVLFAEPGNMTGTLLWPAAAAWEQFSLDSLLPGVAIDLATRLQALQLLAWYSMSHSRAVLPKDAPGPDGAAPAVKLPFATALRNMTARSVWGCTDTLEVAAPAWGESSFAAGAAAVVTSTAGDSPGSSKHAAGSNMKISSADQASQRVVRLVQGLQQQQQQQEVENDKQQQQQQERVHAPEGNANMTPIGEDAHERRRKLQAAAAALSTTVNVLDTYETCEGIRVLITDIVPVPCDFATLLQNFNSIQSVADTSYVPPEHKTLAAAIFEWLQQNGVIAPGQKPSDVQQQSKRWPWEHSSAGDGGVPGAAQQLSIWLGVCLMVWFSWGFLA